MNKKSLLTKGIIASVALVSMLGIPGTAEAKKKCDDKKVAYLFTYFTGNRPEEEQICYAISTDGFNYTPLNNGKPVIASDTISLKKGVRDPHILRGNDGWFYQVVTDMRSSEGWSSNRGMVLMRSRDLVNWEHHTIHFPERFRGTRMAKCTRVWAPQTIYDTKAKKYMVYFSILTTEEGDYDKVYYAYANKDFSDLEGEPQLLFDRGKSSIDTDIVQDDKGLYHIFFKTEGDRQKGILKYTCKPKDLTNEAKWNKSSNDDFWQDTKEAVEGAGVFRLFDENGKMNGDWVLMYDCYMNGHYQFCTSPSLDQKFKYKQNTKTEGAFTPRHGTVIAISQSELDTLNKAFPNK
jgi:hypothetical protein